MVADRNFFLMITNQYADRNGQVRAESTLSDAADSESWRYRLGYSNGNRAGQAGTAGRSGMRKRSAKEGGILLPPPVAFRLWLRT